MQICGVYKVKVQMYRVVFRLVARMKLIPAAEGKVMALDP